ncbi:MAG: radical SAM protein [Acetobacteraceae bacterium]|nr:radical SAM protein [Acetobacteraceae bacterium]
MRLPVFTFQWHFTDICNLRCRHCYRGDGEVAGLPQQQLEAIAADVLESASRLRVRPDLGLTGGEPLAVPQLLFGLMDHLKERYWGRAPLSATLMTNGTLITPEVARRLAAYHPLLSGAQVSLDGASPATNDAIRGRGSFARALEGIAHLVGKTPLRVVISYTFHRGNLGDLEEMVRLTEETGAHVLYATRLVPIGRGRELAVGAAAGEPSAPVEPGGAGAPKGLARGTTPAADLPGRGPEPEAAASLSSEDVRQALEHLYRREQGFASARARGERRPHIAMARTLFHLVDPEEAIRRLKAQREAADGDGAGPPRLGNACAVGFTTATILADATLLACRRMPLPLGNLAQERFLEIWGRSDLLWKFRARGARLKGKCATCRFNREPLSALCRGGAACMSHACLGDFDLPDPHCWYRPEGEVGGLCP